MFLGQDNLKVIGPMMALLIGFGSDSLTGVPWITACLRTFSEHRILMSTVLTMSLFCKLAENTAFCYDSQEGVRIQNGDLGTPLTILELVSHKGKQIGSLNLNMDATKIG